MGRFVEGEDRRQSFLLPASLDDYVTEDNPVRVVEAFIDELDLAALGFDGVRPAATGRPAYHPSTLLKIYLYGYLNRVQSSRRLEREAQRNIELMWLTGRLAPDFKTIADFRRDNGVAIRAACGQFIELCRRLDLFTKAVVAIDGSKFKAVNNRDKNFTATKVAKRIEQVDASIARYLGALDRADREDSDIAEARTSRINEKIAGLRCQMQDLKAMQEQVQAAPDKQLSLTDPDARSMATSGRGTGVVGYNVQTAVDAEHHLIVAHEVTNLGHDRTQLEPMALKAQAATGCEQLTTLADRGYFNGEQVLACEGTGILPCIPKTVWPSERGVFTRNDFVYDPENDHYTCPAGQQLTKGAARSDRKDDIDHYRHLTACFTCALKPNCTPDKLKRLKRWKHEGVMDQMQDRLDRMPHAMGIRRQTVEHPFGTLKSWIGSTHFLTKTLEKVRTEMGLHVLAYNLKRMIQILGTKPLIAAIQT
ncbi:MAG: IS1182 family transposase [Phenylobacterium sp.]|uniref:IS1182 family transposase n=2 Tax=Phenylobacterium sp. TaxID=1871053 RepID=UPI0027269ECF|nr:IS1182 family transposase [Phenylobacterium sp.]